MATRSLKVLMHHPNMLFLYAIEGKTSKNILIIYQGITGVFQHVKRSARQQWLCFFIIHTFDFCN